MEKSQYLTRSHTSAGDAVVSGLFGGLLGGLAMALVIALISQFAGQGFAYLGFFATTSPNPPLQGLLMHLAVSSIYGMLYALIRRWTRLDRLAQVPGWLAGLVYALGLWAFGITVLLPATNSLMLTLPWQVFFCGHIAYGLVLGLRQKP
jgi:hypothetical protein